MEATPACADGWMCRGDRDCLPPLSVCGFCTHGTHVEARGREDAHQVQNRLDGARSDGALRLLRLLAVSKVLLGQNLMKEGPSGVSG